MATRSQTRSSKTDDSVIRFKLDGKFYELDSSAIRGKDAAECRRETGAPPSTHLQNLTESPDLDCIAAVVWLARRQAGERNLAYEKVESELSYQSQLEPAEAPKRPRKAAKDDPEA